VPRIERSANVVWDGNVARGSGTISAETGAFTGMPYTLASRIGNPEGKTSPEELLAAATAGCFTMSLGSELVHDGTPAGHLEVGCTIVMDEVPDEGHQIVGAQIRVHADVDGITDEGFAGTLERAEQGCAFATLLRKAGASVEVSVV